MLKHASTSPLESQSLKRHLGLKETVALGVGGIVGAGIFVLSGVASGRAGPAVILSFLLAFFASGLLGLCYAELCSLFPQAGGPYAFTKEVFGEYVGALVGWVYWGAWVTGSGWVALGFGNNLRLFTGFDPTVGASLLIVGFLLLNLLGLSFSGKIQVSIMIAEIVALIVFIVAGSTHIVLANYQPFAPYGINGIVGAALIGFLSLTGWDVIVVTAEEIKNPRRIVPLAIFSSLAVVLLLYVGVLVVANGILSWKELGASSTPISDVSSRFLGSRGPLILAGITLVALAATANSFFIVISRTTFAMARDGLLPRFLMKTTPKNKTPWLSLLLTAAAQLIVIHLGSIAVLTSATGFLYLLTFLMSVLALIVTRMHGRRGSFSTPGYPVTAILALAICLGMLGTAGSAGFIGGGLWLISGVTFLFPIRHHLEKRKMRHHLEKEKMCHHLERENSDGSTYTGNKK